MACAPMSATVSRSLKPRRVKTSRMCFSPCEASGRRPSGTLDSFASVRPQRNGTSGPPMDSIATQPASAHRSAYGMAGNFFLIGSSHARALSSPALAACAHSGLKRMEAEFGEPSLALQSHVPASCHARRTRLGAAARSSSSASSSAFFTAATSYGGLLPDAGAHRTTAPVKAVAAPPAMATKRAALANADEPAAAVRVAPKAAVDAARAWLAMKARAARRANIIGVSPQ
mmetsp:Transcript_36866/g.113837  ORF Transcript_36866/g.113837 Transcript_36866/m.113837 type:complete len:230 (+) Transcript_36866:433-1122(+)